MSSKLGILFLLLLIFSLGTDQNSYAQCVSVTPWEKVIPSIGLPDSLPIQAANNNLDLISFKSRFYLAFRTAPNHFASRHARIYILSSPDLKSWTFEKEVFKNYDLREPRFAILGDSLFLYCFEGGKRIYKFEPRFIHFTCTDGTGSWTKDQNAGIDGYVPWRIRNKSDTLYLSAYDGRNLYAEGHAAELRLFKSSDGRNWSPISEQPQLTHPRSVSEGEFLFADNGDIWGVARLEYDGAYIFHAKAENLPEWKFKYSPQKHDSSLMFEYDGLIFLVSRRNLDGDGRFIKTEGKPKKNLLRYSFTRKVTALFVLDKEKMEWIHIQDFASTGDTAFPGIAEIEPGKWHLFNYSSDISKRKKIWIGGQFGPTHIYKTILSLDPECIRSAYGVD